MDPILSDNLPNYISDDNSKPSEKEGVQHRSKTDQREIDEWDRALVHASKAGHLEIIEYCKEKGGGVP